MQGVSIGKGKSEVEEKRPKLKEATKKNIQHENEIRENKRMCVEEEATKNGGLRVLWEPIATKLDEQRVKTSFVASRYEHSGEMMASRDWEESSHREGGYNISARFFE